MFESFGRYYSLPLKIMIYSDDKPSLYYIM